MANIPTRRRGDKAPALNITIMDVSDEADFSTITASDVLIQVERDGTKVIEDAADSYTPAQDNNSAVVVRNWQDGDLDVVGRYWISIYVTPWDQTFPDDGPLRLDVVRAAGDA